MQVIIFGGILIPFMISFFDITLRTVTQEALTPDSLLFISFSLMFMLYSFGYYQLFKWLLKSYDVEAIALRDQIILVTLISDLIIYGTLFNLDNTFSNLIWAGFYLLLLSTFFLIAQKIIQKKDINHL